MATRFRRPLGQAPLALLALLALALTVPVHEANAQGPPSATTLDATGVFDGGATLNGYWDPNGDPMALAWFEWSGGPDTRPFTGGGYVSAEVGMAHGPPLTAGATYYFQLVAANQWGTAYGGENSFTTPGGVHPPTLVTLPATDVTSSSATLNGGVDGASFVWFDWGTSTAYGNQTSSIGFGTSAGPFSATIAGLTPNTTYHFCAAGQRGMFASGYGGDQSFTTLGLVSTLPATAVTTNSATLNGTVNPNGRPATAWFQWGATTNYGNIISVTNLGSETNALPLSAQLTGLTPSVTYHFRVAATNDYGLVYGSDQSFTTLGSPLVSTLPATGVSTTSATLNGTVNPDGWPTTVWFQWGATTNYGNLTPVTALGSGTTALPLSGPLAGLTPGTTYHFQAVASNSFGVVYGSDQSFTPGEWMGEFTYTVTNGAVTIIKYLGLGGAVTIPGTINGLPVTTIGGYYNSQGNWLGAFASDYYNSCPGCQYIASVTIPNTVTDIGSCAFWSCTSLANITIPNSVTSIGDSAFDGCASLANITIPNSVTNMGQSAFGNCSGLTSVTIGNKLTSIADAAFESCTSLINATIGANVTSIGIQAFSYCPSLTNITIPDTVTNIGYMAFLSCGLRSVTIPDSVTSIGDQAFGRCDRLSAITVDPLNAAYSSADGVLFDKSQITLVQCPETKSGSYSLSNSITTIGDDAFGDCTSLTNITIPDSVTNIGDYAFTDCTSLTSIAIPDSVTHIGGGAFGLCTNLTSITIPDNVTSIGNGAFARCTSLTNVRIGNSVTSIGVQAFYYCTSLVNVTIGNSVTNIEDGAFYYCPSLTALYFAGSAPSLGSEVFDGDTHATVYYLPWTFGWGTTFGGRPTAVWQSPPPGVWTLSASTITTTGATLKGTVNPNGYPTTAWFQWGTTTDYGQLTAATGMGSGTSALPISAPLAALTPGTTYHYRVAATNSNGAVYGSDQSFTTLGPPLVSSLPATAVSTNSATLNGAVNPNGYPTAAWFQWGATTNYGNLTAATALGSGTTALPLSAPLAGLTPAVTYHFRVAATNDYGLAYGSDQSFTTASLLPPQVSTLPSTSVSPDSATLNGAVNPNGWPTTAWFQWGTTANYGNLTSVTALGSGTAALPLSAPLAGLTPSVTYHFRVAATNDNGVAYGSDQSFTTLASSGDAGWTLNGEATMTGNTITLTVGAGDTSRSAFLNNKQDVTAFHIVFFYQDVSGAGSADGVTFCIQNDPRGATALGGGNGGSSLGYDNITPSVALAMNIYDPNTRGIAFAQNGARGPDQSLLPNVDIGGNTNIIQVNVDYNGTVMTMTFKDTVTGGIASTNWTVNIPSVVGGSTAYVGFTGADGGVASIQTITWAGSTPTILIPPRTQTAEAGSAVGLSVHASSALPLSFLWYLNDTNLIRWSTNSDLELTNVQISDSGVYTVVVSNASGTVTSAPAMLNVIAAVERRPVPGVMVTGEAASLLNVDYANSLSPAPNWTPLGTVSLTGTPQYCFDLTLPLPPQRFYRAWQTGTPGVRPSLDLHLVPAITLTGTIGHSVRLDYINQFGPTDAWVTLATVPLTNTSQLYFDISAPGQPPRLYRLVPSP